MNQSVILDAISHIDSDLIEHYFQTEEKLKKQKSRKLLQKWIAVAACICVILGGALHWHLTTFPVITTSRGIVYDWRGVTIPKKDEFISGDEMYDRDPFFIYDDALYDSYQVMDLDTSLVGNKVRTAGMLDCFGEVGSYDHDIYSLKGFSPSFMLCTFNSESLRIYTRTTDITVKYGSDIFEDGFHLSQLYCSAEYRPSTYADVGSSETRKIEDPFHPVIVNFIAAMNNGKFIPYEVVAKREGYLSDPQLPIYRSLYLVSFQLSNGITVRVRLLKDGYVIFTGLREICIQIPEDTFNAFIHLLEQT